MSALEGAARAVSRRLAAAGVGSWIDLPGRFPAQGNEERCGVAEGRDETRQKDRASNKYAAKKAATERIAQQRAAQQRAERRRNVLVAGGSTLGVLIVVAVIVIVGINSKKGGSSSGGNAVNAASSTVTDAISKTATSTLSNTPAFAGINPPTKIPGGSALTSSAGLPEVLYVGAEYCPNCAATRWPLAIALARFGSFSNLQTTYSSDSDADPHTPTLSFHGSSYTSQYISFVGKEQVDGVGKPLETLTKQENDLFQAQGGSPAGSAPGYPFIDFGGTWKQNGTSFDPGTLKGMTPDAVAKAMSDPTTKSGKIIQASADVYTALICEIDGGKPSNVCTAPSVAAAETALNAGK
jgi:hypothetical protein